MLPNTFAAGSKNWNYHRSMLHRFSFRRISSASGLEHNNNFLILTMSQSWPTLLPAWTTPCGWPAVEPSNELGEPGLDNHQPSAKPSPWELPNQYDKRWSPWTVGFNNIKHKIHVEKLVYHEMAILQYFSHWSISKPQSFDHDPYSRNLAAIYSSAVIVISTIPADIINR